MTRAQLIAAVSARSDFPQSKTSEVVDLVFDVIQDTLAHGENVVVTGFGTFSAKHKGKRQGTNPRTGEAMTLEPKTVVKFKGSSILQGHLNDGNDE